MNVFKYFLNFSRTTYHKVVISTGLFMIGIVNPISGQEPVLCDCRSDIEFTYQKLTESQSYKTQSANARAVDSRYNTLLNDTGNHRIDAYNCYILLVSLIDELDDHHNEILGVTRVSSTELLKDSIALARFRETPPYRLIPRPKLDLDSLEQSLISKGNDEIEGIYRFISSTGKTVFRAALYKEGGRFQAVVLETSLPLWSRGEMVFTLIPNGKNRYRHITALFGNKRLFSSGIERFREGRLVLFGWSKVPVEKDYYNVPFPDERYVIKDVNENTTYLKLGSFKTSYESIQWASRFHDSIRDYPFKPHLILDLRNNSGGGGKNSDRFRKLLKGYKGQITVLINFKTASNAEIFTLGLKPWKNVQIMGDASRGVLAYGRNYNTTFPTPSGLFEVGFTDMWGTRKYRELEGRGVEPDRYLDPNREWIVQVMELKK